MRVVVYRNHFGKIVEHQSVPEKMTVKELTEKIVIWNRTTSRSLVAELHEIEDDSFEEYLYQKAEARARWNREALQDLKQILSDADDLVTSLIHDLDVEEE